MESFVDKVIDLYPWMKIKARMFCKDKEDMDDLVSETVLRLLQNHEKYDNTYDLKPWCMVVMKNLYTNWYQRRLIIPFVNYDDAYCYCSAETSDNFEVAEIVRKQSRESLNVHCLDLYIQGYSYEEISSMMGIKIGTVRSRIHNGRKRLKAALEV